MYKIKDYECIATYKIEALTALSKDFTGEQKDILRRFVDMLSPYTKKFTLMEPPFEEIRRHINIEIETERLVPLDIMIKIRVAIHELGLLDLPLIKIKIGALGRYVYEKLYEIVRKEKNLKEAFTRVEKEILRRLEHV